MMMLLGGNWTPPSSTAPDPFLSNPHSYYKRETYLLSYNLLSVCLFVTFWKLNG